MTTLARGIATAWRSTRPVAREAQPAHGYGHRRLDWLFRAAPRVWFGDSDRFVFFSDCHRGDGSRADAFSKNEGIFLGALGYYYREGFTYIEVGDGDELWQNRRLQGVRLAHPRTFEMLHEFHLDHRLHIIVGNHDVPGARFREVEKDGIATTEGLVLHHQPSGRWILVTHGHQADIKSDRLRWLGKFAVRHIWKRLQVLGLVRGSGHPDAGPGLNVLERQVADAQDMAHRATERRLRDWVRSRDQMVICGHTHRAAFPQPGMPAYLNTGCCVNPGAITGLEIKDGEVMLVRWAGAYACGANPTPPIERRLIAPPRSLVLLN